VCAYNAAPGNQHDRFSPVAVLYALCRTFVMRQCSDALVININYVLVLCVVQCAVAFVPCAVPCAMLYTMCMRCALCAALCGCAVCAMLLVAA
jgi:hypothetical protein